MAGASVFMPTLYKVKFYTGEYAQRQRAANRDGAVCYAEQHMNSGSTTADYTVAVVATNASQKSKDWARYYAKSVAKHFQIKVANEGGDVGDDGLFVGGWDGKRGNANLSETAMPAVLLEPLFAGNPKHAAWIRSEQGRVALARILAESIKRFFPKGGLVAFSVGHRYKPSNPHDRGAPVHGSLKLAEADYSEMILLEAMRMLEAEK